MADLTYDGSILAFWVTSLTAPTAPSTAQIVAGIPLHLHMPPNGLTRGAGQDTIDTSKINSTFTTNAVGRRTFAPQVTVIRTDDDADGVEAGLTFKATGWLCVRDDTLASVTPAAGDKWDVYPGQIGNANKSDPAPNTLQTIAYTITMTADANIGAVAVA